MVPARVNLSTDVMIKPHILNRPKVNWHTASSVNVSHNVTIDETEISDMTASYTSKLGIISESLEYFTSGSYTTKIALLQQLASSSYDSASYKYESVA